MQHRCDNHFLPARKKCSNNCRFKCSSKGFMFLKKKKTKHNNKATECIRFLREKKKRVYLLWKNGHATQKTFKDIVRSCRNKIKKVNARLKLNLATSVTCNKKDFFKCINNKTGPRKTSMLYWKG